MRSLTLLCLATIMLATQIQAQTCPAPGYANATVTFSQATITWPYVQSVEEYEVDLYDITDTNEIEEIDGVFTALNTYSTPPNSIIQGHTYMASIKPECDEDWNNNLDSATVIFQPIVIEDILYLPPTTCGLNNCDCNLSTWWNNRLIAAGGTAQRVWLPNKPRQIVSLSIRDAAAPTTTTTFKIAKNQCNSNIEVLGCTSTGYSLQNVGDNYLRVRKNTNSAIVANIYIESNRLRVKAVSEAIRATLRLCDTCSTCATSGLIGGNGIFNLQADTPQGLKISPNPTTDITELTWSQPDDAPVSLIITDAFGRHIATPHPQFIATRGTNSLTFDASKLPPGLYAAILTGREETRTTFFIRP